MSCLRPWLAGGGGRPRAATLAFALAASATAIPAGASSFRVSPVIVSVATAQRSAALSVENLEDSPVPVRVQLFRWTQSDGKDIYTPTDDLIASPPIFTLAPNDRQLLRVGSRAGALSGAYRVIIEEIPRPSDQGGGHVSILLRLNVPLYAFDGKSKADLSWKGWIDASGELLLEADNTGGTYEQILQIGSENGGAETRLTSRMGVVLPGGSHRWNVGKHPEVAPGATLRIAVGSSDGAIGHYQLSIASR